MRANCFLRLLCAAIFTKIIYPNAGTLDCYLYIIDIAATIKNCNNPYSLSHCSLSFERYPSFHSFIVQKRKQRRAGRFELGSRASKRITCKNDVTRRFPIDTGPRSNDRVDRTLVYDAEDGSTLTRERSSCPLLRSKRF